MRHMICYDIYQINCIFLIFELDSKGIFDMIATSYLSRDCKLQFGHPQSDLSFHKIWQLASNHLDAIVIEIFLPSD